MGGGGGRVTLRAKSLPRAFELVGPEDVAQGIFAKLQLELDGVETMILLNKYDTPTSLSAAFAQAHSLSGEDGLLVEADLSVLFHMARERGFFSGGGAALPESHEQAAAVLSKAAMDALDAEGGLDLVLVDLRVNGHLAAIAYRVGSDVRTAAVGWCQHFNCQNDEENLNFVMSRIREASERHQLDTWLKSKGGEAITHLPLAGEGDVVEGRVLFEFTLDANYSPISVLQGASAHQLATAWCKTNGVKESELPTVTNSILRQYANRFGDTPSRSNAKRLDLVSLKDTNVMAVASTTVLAVVLLSAFLLYRSSRFAGKRSGVAKHENNNSRRRGSI